MRNGCLLAVSTVKQTLFTIIYYQFFTREKRKTMINMTQNAKEQAAALAMAA